MIGSQLSGVSKVMAPPAMLTSAECTTPTSRVATSAIARVGLRRKFMRAPVQWGQGRNDAWAGPATPGQYRGTGGHGRPRPGPAPRCRHSILSLVIAGLILAGTLKLLRDTLHVLME